MKLTFMEQHGEVSAQNPLGAWQSQFTQLRVPNMFDLRADPFERATTSIYYADWQVRHVFYQVPAQAIVARMLETCKEFPPRAKAASFTVSDAIDRDGKPKPELTALQQMGLCPTVMLWTALHHPREHNSC
jgi:arylsulfatase